MTSVAIPDGAVRHWPNWWSRYDLFELAPTVRASDGGVTRTFLAIGRRGAQYGCVAHDERRFHWINASRSFGTVPFDLAQVNPVRFNGDGEGVEL